ncbi:MAG: ribonuclease HII [Minisyncoccia bacterium]
MSYMIGIDEAGRGPLAGPVAVGVVSVRDDFNKNFFKSIKDSKKLTEVERELWYALALEAKKKGVLNFTVSLVSEKVVDRHGIAFAIRLGIKRALKSLKVSRDTQIFLDGGIAAPPEFRHQRTVVRGDEKIPVVSLASIVAKVTRDRKMRVLSRKFPGYGFDIHKGYGTLAHRKAIQKYGLAEIHRKSFTKGLVSSKR